MRRYPIKAPPSQPLSPSRHKAHPTSRHNLQLVAKPAVLEVVVQGAGLNRRRENSLRASPCLSGSRTGSASVFAPRKPNYNLTIGPESNTGKNKDVLFIWQIFIASFLDSPSIYVCLLL